MDADDRWMPGSRWLIPFAWAAMLLVSNLPDMLFDQFAGSTPSWLFWAKAGLLLILAVFAWFWKAIRPLRFFFLILLVLTLLWWLVFSWIMLTPAWQDWTAGIPWVLGLSAIQLMKLGVALVAVLVLFMIYRHRARFFLVKGQADAMAEPVRWLGMNGPLAWKKLALIFALVGGTIMLLVLFLTTPTTTGLLIRTLPLLPAVLLFSATNALSEEICFRSSLIAPLHGILGKAPTMALTAVYFGLAHYSGGVPLATLPTLLMTGFLGYFMGKAMLETRGFFCTWLIHCVNDIPVFFFLALGSIAAGG